MKYFAGICGRAALLLLLTAFTSTAALEGYARACVNCCGECCPPGSHHAASLAEEKLSAGMPASCCSGISGPQCDLSTQPASLDRRTLQAIPSASGGISAIPAGVRSVETDPGRTATPKPPLSAGLLDPQPIYLAIRSLLI